MPDYVIGSIILSLFVVLLSAVIWGLIGLGPRWNRAKEEFHNASGGERIWWTPKAAAAANLANWETEQRALGHTEAYIDKAREIRELQIKHKDAKAGLAAAWIGGITCMFVFPPIGIGLTGFAAIMSIREGMKYHKETKQLEEQIVAEKETLPEH